MKAERTRINIAIELHVWVLASHTKVLKLILLDSLWTNAEVPHDLTWCPK